MGVYRNIFYWWKPQSYSFAPLCSARIGHSFIAMTTVPSWYSDIGFLQVPPSLYRGRLRSFQQQHEWSCYKSCGWISPAGYTWGSWTWRRRIDSVDDTIIANSKKSLLRNAVSFSWECSTFRSICIRFLMHSLLQCFVSSLFSTTVVRPSTTLSSEWCQVVGCVRALSPFRQRRLRLWRLLR